MSDKMIFQVQAIIVSDSSMATGGRKFVLHTAENLDPAKVKKLIELENKPGWFTFNADMIDVADLTNLPKIDNTRYTEGKSPSQRLRAVMYLLHKQKGGTDKGFPVVYDTNIEKLIEQYKNQLD